jgi:hypothetical protein
MKNLTIKNRQLTSGFDRGNVIAAWTYTNDDWKRYLCWQQQRRRRYVWIQVVTVVTMGGIICLLQMSTACGFHALKKKNIIITATGVVIRKRFIPFNTNNRQLKTIDIIEGRQSYVLTISCHSVNSQKKTTTLFIPVPRGKLGEAVRLVMHFEKTVNGQ